MTKGLLNQEVIIVIILYAPNNRAPNTQSKTERSKEKNRKLNSSSEILEFLTFSCGRTVKENINREIEDEHTITMYTQQVCIKHSTQRQQKTHSSQAPMEHSSR